MTAAGSSGVARYADGELHWIPLLGVATSGRATLSRGAALSFPGVVSSTVDWLRGRLLGLDAAHLSLAMSDDALTGFLAWLESAPPSAYLDVA